MLAQTALLYESGLVVTNGPAHKASAPLYPQLLKVPGAHAVIVRGGMFNAFLFPEFVDAVRAARRKNIVVVGLTTEGCALQTILGGLREGYRVHVVMDTCAGQTKETHDAAIFTSLLLQEGLVHCHRGRAGLKRVSLSAA